MITQSWFLVERHFIRVSLYYFIYKIGVGFLFMGFTYCLSCGILYVVDESGYSSTTCE
jgi:hypothetical protein